MFISSIEIENYRSFKTKQKVNCANKNLIIGKNGSGKSNLLSALAACFLFSDDKTPSYNGNDSSSSITLCINNSERRFPLPATFSIAINFFNGSAEYSISGNPVSKEELRGMIENAGFSSEAFVFQGTVTSIASMTASERFKLVSRIAGVLMYDESRAMALSYLNDDAKIESMIEKIELKTKKTEEYKKKKEEYDKLMMIKNELEYDLMKQEIADLNVQIDELNTVNEVVLDENMIELETAECREEILRLTEDLSATEKFLSKFDENLIRQISDQNLLKECSAKTEEYALKKKELTSKLEELDIQKRDKTVEAMAIKFFESTMNSSESIEDLESKIREYKSISQKAISSKHLHSDRRNLWIEEKKMKEELSSFIEEEKSLQGKLLYLGKQSINIYDSIKNEFGVLGTVYDLFEVKEDFLEAYEAVTRSSFFWIVVNDDEVATNMINKIEGRQTFVPLNRVKHQKDEKQVKDKNLIKLSDQISCDQKFSQIADFITRDFYVAPDINSGMELSLKYNINIVTLDGDIIGYDGAITGGYEAGSTILRDLKTIKAKICKCKMNLEGIQSKLLSINNSIKMCEIEVEGDNSDEERTLAVIRCMEYKIQYIKNKKIKLKDENLLSAELRQICENIPKLKLEIETMDQSLQKYRLRQEKIDKVKSKIDEKCSILKKLQDARQREKKLIDSLYIKKDDVENDSRKQKMHLLMENRAVLLKKTGIADFNIQPPNNGSLEKLKEVNKKLKGYYGFNSKDLIPDDNLREKLDELRNSKNEIIDFIYHLDQKKDDTLRLTFSMICDNYSYFFRTITGRTSALVLNGESVDISIDNIITNISSLSGGQKTIIAVCLILAIQKNDPSPFYIFDEIDANLDPEYCKKIYSLIDGSDSQFFITSFKKESLYLADNFLGIVVNEKESFIGQITRELAEQTLSS